MGKESQPGSTTTNYPDIPLPPDYNYQQGFWSTLAPMLLGGAMPTYPGSIDPGYSPTTQTAMRMAQGYAQSPAPSIMGQVHGTLGNAMNQATNPYQNIGSINDPTNMYFNMPKPPSLPGPNQPSPWASAQQQGAPYQTRFQGGGWPPPQGPYGGG